MRLVVAHKGKKSFRCRVRGHEAHSSLTPRGVNAVQVACEIVTFLTQMGRRFRDRGGFDAAYDVPYTTVHTGVIRGGTALNIVPRDCSFDFEFRHLPFDDPDALLAEVRRFAATLLPEMHAVSRDTYIEFDALSTSPASIRTAAPKLPSSDAPAAGRTSSARCPSAPRLRCSTAATFPAIICGPGHIEQAHQPNEWISLEQLALLRVVHATARRSHLRDVSRRRRSAGAVSLRRRHRSRWRFPTSRATRPATAASAMSGRSQHRARARTW